MLHNILRQNAVNCVLKQRLTVVGPFCRNKSHIINYCIFKVTSETEDKVGKVIWLNGPKESEKQVKKPPECPKRVRNKGNYGSFVELSRLDEMVKYELYECFY